MAVNGHPIAMRATFSRSPSGRHRRGDVDQKTGGEHQNRKSVIPKIISSFAQKENGPGSSPAFQGKSSLDDRPGDALTRYRFTVTRPRPQQWPPKLRRRVPPPPMPLRYQPLTLHLVAFCAAVGFAGWLNAESSSRRSPCQAVLQLFPDVRALRSVRPDSIPWNWR